MKVTVPSRPSQAKEAIISLTCKSSMCAFTASNCFPTSDGGFSRPRAAMLAEAEDLSLPFRSEGRTTFLDMAYCHRVRMLTG